MIEIFNDTLDSAQRCPQLPSDITTGRRSYAMEFAGGAGFYRSACLEPRFRDIQAAPYHPLQAGPQTEYAGSMALGLPIARIY